MKTEEIIKKLDRLLSENKGQEAQQLLERLAAPAKVGSMAEKPA